MTRALGWALIHFLWQGALIAIVVRAVLALVPARRSSLRYVIAVIGLALMPLAVTLTAFGAWDGASQDPAGLDRSGSASAGASASSDESLPRGDEPTSTISAPAPVAVFEVPASLRSRVDSLTPLIVGVWLAGVLLLALRLLGGWLSTRRLVRTGVEPVSASVHEVFARLAARLGVRRAVTVLSSSVARVPAVVGWLKPVILLPTSALIGLTPAQLEIVLAHELAHIRRHDYLVNLAQSVLETLLFYHPAVWWVGARIRDERENCCDDLAVGVAGSPVAYAEALLSLETMRGLPAPALAATGGSLLSRIERILGAQSSREVLPRWVAGLAALLLLASGSVGAALVAAPPVAIEEVSAEPPEDKQQPSAAALAQDPEAAPDTVLHAPRDMASLADRIAWAHSDAERRNARGYWVAWTIQPNPSFGRMFFMGRLDRVGGLAMEGAVIGGHIVMSGESFGTVTSSGDLSGWRLPGPPLAPLVGAPPGDIAVLYLYERRGREPRLARVQAATASLPVHFERRALYWLGAGDDATSLREARQRYQDVTGRLREDMVGMIGVHGSSAAVVPILIGILDSSESSEIRGNAAEWLARHPSTASLARLAHAAREDRVADIRSEAAESIGEMKGRAAFDTLVVLARELTDSEARGEAVEAFSNRTEREAVSVLVSIANTDRNADVQREAVETLGEFEDGRGLSALRDLARSHPVIDVRREAVETISEHGEPGDVLPLLRQIAFEDRSSEVQREAVESMGEMHTTSVVEELRSIAERHPNMEVQREAVETLGETIDNAVVAPVLARLARSHRSMDVRREAVETLGERFHHEPAALDSLLALLDGNQEPDLVREIVETLGEIDSPRARRAIRGLGEIRDKNKQ